MKRIFGLLLFITMIPIIGIIVTEITVRLTAFPENKITPEARADIEKTNRLLVMCRGAPIANLLFWRKKLQLVEKAINQDFIKPYAPEHEEYLGKTHDITYSFYGLFGIKGEEIIYYADHNCKHTILLE